MGILLWEDLQRRIKTADHLDSLRKLRELFHENVHDLIPDKSTNTIQQVRYINKAHDLFIQRTITLSESEMMDSGMGPPPVPYDFVLFGSGGRQEQTLWSDQDNGIIYSSRKEEADVEAVSDYFTELSGIIVKSLEKVGYPPCDGDVVCSNPKWRMPIEKWISMTEEWFSDPHWEHVRYLLITADIRCVYGRGLLTKKFKKHFDDLVALKPSILLDMVHNTLRYKILLGIFGHLIKERFGENSGGIDIKYGAYIPMVNGIRLLAIQAGISESSTIERINQLKSRQLIIENLADEWEYAFANLLMMRSKTYHEVDQGHYTSNGILKSNELSKGLIYELKDSLRIGKEMQRYIKKNIRI